MADQTRSCAVSEQAALRAEAGGGHWTQRSGRGACQWGEARDRLPAGAELAAAGTGGNVTRRFISIVEAFL